MRKLVILLAFSLLASTLACSTSQQAKPRTDSNFKDSADDDVSKTAKLFIERLANGDFDNAGKDFDDTMKDALPPQKLREFWTTLLTQVGNFKSLAGTKMDFAPPYQLVFLKCEFERGQVVFRVVLNQSKQIVGYFIERPS